MVMLKLASCKAVNGQRKCSVLAMYVVHCSSSYILVLPLIHCTHPPLGQTKVKREGGRKKLKRRGENREKVIRKGRKTNKSEKNRVTKRKNKGRNKNKLKRRQREKQK